MKMYSTRGLWKKCIIGFSQRILQNYYLFVHLSEGGYNNAEMELIEQCRNGKK
jgi:hypothetical protein